MKGAKRVRVKRVQVFCVHDVKIGKCVVMRHHRSKLIATPETIESYEREGYVRSIEPVVCECRKCLVQRKEAARREARRTAGGLEMAK